MGVDYMMSLSRRTLLVGGVAGVVVAGTGIAAIGVAAAHPAEHLVRAVIRDRFPDIRMTEDDLGRFTADFLVHGVSPAERWMLRLARSVPGFVSNEGLRARLPGRLRQKLLAVEDNIMNMFLLSTDFFLRRSEDGPMVTYQTYADPLVNPCTNPLACFDR
jgi:hypothetical protein